MVFILHPLDLTFFVKKQGGQRVFCTIIHEKVVTLRPDCE